MGNRLRESVKTSGREFHATGVPSFLPIPTNRFRVSAVNKYGYSDTLENSESVLIGTMHK